MHTRDPKEDMMERKLCEITGAKYAVVMTNGTFVLCTACFIAGIGLGDEVITALLAFMASEKCVLYCGAKPILADVNPAYTSHNITRLDMRDTVRKLLTTDYVNEELNHNAHFSC